MLITNNSNQDYWFGPLHIPALAVGVVVDDTTATSLYLTDDGVADAINTLSASGKITVSSAATPFPRPTGSPEVLHGDGSPEGLVYAGQGSLYLRRDNGSVYTKSTGIHLNSGWAALSQGAITTSPYAGGPPALPADKEIWIATAVGSFAERHMYQYGESEPSFKWLFIGGPAIDNEVTTSESTSSGTYADLATVGPSFTCQRTGEYLVDIGALAVWGVATNSTAMIQLWDSTAGAAVGLSARFSPGSAAAAQANLTAQFKIGLVSGRVYKLRYLSSAAISIAFSNRILRVTPIRTI